MPTKLKIWGIFSILIIKLEVNTYLLLENFTEYNDLDYFQIKKITIYKVFFSENVKAVSNLWFL